MTSEPLGPAKTNVSKKGRVPCSLADCCKLYVGVKGIKVGEKMLGVFCLVDDKGVILVPNPYPGRIGANTNGSGLEVLHEQVSYQWAYGGSNGSPMYLLIILTLECEKSTFEAELQG